MSSVRDGFVRVHRWCGLALALYVVMLSVTGSLLVYRSELESVLGPFVALRPTATPLTESALRAAIELAQPGWVVRGLGSHLDPPNVMMEVLLERAGQTLEVAVDPYTGAVLGDPRPPAIDALDWVADLHDRLLAGSTGSVVNAFGSAAVLALAATGVVVWWPARGRWRRALTIQWRAPWPRWLWDVHNAVGAWTLPMLAMWALSGVYLGLPSPFASLIDSVSDPQALPGERVGDRIVGALVELHFGRFQGHPVLKALWAVLGLSPAVMAVTGGLLWWRRWRRGRNPSVLVG